MFNHEDYRLFQLREKRIREEWEKPLKQYQRGLLTAEDLVDALTEGVVRAEAAMGVNG